MGISKNRKNHSKKLNNYKQQKQMEKNQQEQMNQQMQIPEHQQIPIWAQDADISVKGVEWEIMLNAINGMQMAMQAAQSIMSRNIVNGVVKMDFTKLNAAGTDYEAMTDEEKAPLIAKFEDTIKAFKTQQADAQKEVAYAQAINESADKTKQAVNHSMSTSDGEVTADGETPLTSENAGAKIITMDTKG